MFVPQRQPNLFSILDSESKSPQATDATLVQNLGKLLEGQPQFSRIEGDELGFRITHYADEV